MGVARHQFKNDISWHKKLIEVAALMGHMSLTSAKYRYGEPDKMWLPEETRGFPQSVCSDVIRIEDHLEAKKQAKRKGQS